MKNLLRCFIKRTYSINAVALLVAVSLLGDHLVSRIHQKHAVKAICDNSTHFLIGGISWLIVCINTSFLQNHTQCLLEILLCAFIAAVIDVDHFISAKSLSLKVLDNVVCFDNIPDRHFLFTGSYKSQRKTISTLLNCSSCDLCVFFYV